MYNLTSLDREIGEIFQMIKTILWIAITVSIYFHGHFAFLNTFQSVNSF